MVYLYHRLRSGLFLVRCSSKTYSKWLATSSRNKQQWTLGFQWSGFIFYRTSATGNAVTHRHIQDYNDLKVSGKYWGKLPVCFYVRVNTRRCKTGLVINPTPFNLNFFHVVPKRSVIILFSLFYSLYSFLIYIIPACLQLLFVIQLGVML